jgi:hypothetical protein
MGRTSVAMTRSSSFPTSVKDLLMRAPYRYAVGVKAEPACSAPGGLHSHQGVRRRLCPHDLVIEGRAVFSMHPSRTGCNQVILPESSPLLRECQPEGPALLTAFKLNLGAGIKPTPRWTQAATPTLPHRSATQFPSEVPIEATPLSGGPLSSLAAGQARENGAPAIKPFAALRMSEWNVRVSLTLVNNMV